MLSIVVHGVERVQDLLGRAQRKVSDLEEPTRKAVLYVHQEMPDYPPPPAGSRYRRTGTLGRSVTTLQGAGEPLALSRVESLGNEVTGIVGTAVEYAPYVINEDRSQGPTQARVHKGRWWTLQAVVRGARKGIRKIYEDHVKQAFSGWR